VVIALDAPPRSGVQAPQTSGTNDAQAISVVVRSGRLRRLCAALLCRPHASSSTRCLRASVVFFFVFLLTQA